MEAHTIARGFANQAKDKSRDNGGGYAFAFGYLTGTLTHILNMLTPEQREALAKQLR